MCSPRTARASSMARACRRDLGPVTTYGWGGDLQHASCSNRTRAYSESKIQPEALNLSSEPECLVNRGEQETVTKTRAMAVLALVKAGASAGASLSRVAQRSTSAHYRCEGACQPLKHKHSRLVESWLGEVVISPAECSNCGLPHCGATAPSASPSYNEETSNCRSLIFSQHTFTHPLTHSTGQTQAHHTRPGKLLLSITPILRRVRCRPVAGRVQVWCRWACCIVSASLALKLNLAEWCHQSVRKLMSGQLWHGRAVCLGTRTLLAAWLRPVVLACTGERGIVSSCGALWCAVAGWACSKWKAAGCRRVCSLSHLACSPGLPLP